ncbi:MAG TPA: PDZ domain-containing protein [Epsilonproteobacteria bacterium]|nr:PDZ domain-containing protein [Campylobacterota bacterium]
MKHLFKPEVFKGIFGILVLLLIIKILWFVVEVLWLPATGVDQVSQKGGKALYYRVKLTPNEAAAPVITTRKTPVKQASGSIKEIKLLAIYNASDATVVTVAYKSKTKVLSRGENINGFVLEGAGNNFATFSKKAKTYKVYLVKEKSSGTSSVKAVNATEAKTKNVALKGDVTDAGDHKIIDRALLDHYATNMDDIYKNIGIAEVRDGKDLTGFRVTFVRKDSPFAKLGVQRDDVIKSMNGQEINSYNAAFGVYKNIQNIDNLTLVIQRGKEEMELEYEIN